jgi:hypothetical protein
VTGKMRLQKKNAGMCEKKSLPVLPGNPSVCGRILCKTVVTQRKGYFHDRHFKIISIEIATLESFFSHVPAIIEFFGVTDLLHPLL